MSHPASVPRFYPGRNGTPLLTMLLAAALLLAGHRSFRNFDPALARSSFGNLARAQAAGSPDTVLPNSFGNFERAGATVDEGLSSFGNFRPARQDGCPTQSGAAPTELLIGRGEFVRQFLIASAGTDFVSVTGCDFFVTGKAEGLVRLGRTRRPRPLCALSEESSPTSRLTPTIRHFNGAHLPSLASDLCNRGRSAAATRPAGGRRRGAARGRPPR